MTAVRTTADRAAGRTVGVFARRMPGGVSRGRRWREGLLEGALIAGTVGIGVVALVGAADAAAVREASYCAPIVIDQTGNPDAPGNAGEVAALMSKGWRGDPGDGMEAIYPPGCLTTP